MIRDMDRWPIYSLADHLVSLLAWPAGDREQQTSDSCGISISGSLARLGPDGTWRKMYRDSYQLTLDELSEAFSGRWPKWGMMRSGAVMVLTPSVPLTSETGSSSWATPAAGDAVGSTGGGQGRSLRTDTRWPTPKSTVSGPDYARPNRPEKAGDDLATAVTRWPTPNTVDARGGTRNLADSQRQQQLAHIVRWPTPQHRDYNSSSPLDGDRADRKLGRHLGKDLTDVVRWTTPKARDYRSPRDQTGAGESRHEPDLNVQMHVAEGKPLLGQLNPDWVETLMGFPIGWTEIDGPAPRSSRRKNGNRRGSGSISRTAFRGSEG